MEIARIAPALTPKTAAMPAPPQNVGPGFRDILGSAIDTVNDKQLAAQQAITDFAAGKADNVHDVMLAEVEADISFKMLAQTRNKLVEAYKEIMRMDV